MQGGNKNRTTGKWTPIVKPETKALAARAQEMFKGGNSISNIAKLLEVSEARVREYLKVLDE